MARKKYINNTTEAIIDAEMELNREFEEEITETSPAEVETHGPKTINGTIINSLFVNVRREPSFESEVIEVLRKGDRVIILGKDGDFYKVSTSINKTAYIYFEFIKEE